MIEQSLALCCSLSAIGGVLEVGATAVTAVPAVREQEGKKMSSFLYFVTLAGNVGLQLTGSLMSHLVATWFGPVSIVVPFFYSATLLSNMLIFGAILGLEFFTKNMQVGTYVIVCAVILLPVVGPTIQEDQDIGALFKHWYASVWFSMLLLAMSITGTLLMMDITRYSMPARTFILLIVRASSISVNLSVSRSFVLGLSEAVFALFLVIKIVSGAIYTYAIVIQSTAVDQARFVPLNTTTIIVVNALTGIIIWEDWKVMQSWYGYACVFCLLGLGVDLLLSVPLLNEDNPDYGATRRTSMILAVKQPMNLENGGYHTVPDAEAAEIASTDNVEADAEAEPDHPVMSRLEALRAITKYRPESSARSASNAMRNIVDVSVSLASQTNAVPGDTNLQSLRLGKKLAAAPITAGRQAMNAASNLTQQGKDGVKAFFTRKPSSQG